MFITLKPRSPGSTGTGGKAGRRFGASRSAAESGSLCPAGRADYRQELDRLPGEPGKGRGAIAEPVFAPLAENREKLQRLIPEGLTRGHFYRGVIAAE